MDITFIREGGIPCLGERGLDIKLFLCLYRAVKQ